MANLIAFMAFLAFLDSIIGWIGEMVDIPTLSFKVSLHFYVALFVACIAILS